MSSRTKRPSSRIVGVALLAPGIAVHVIAALLPETRLVARCEAQALDPFRALPEIQVRYEQPRRSAVLRRHRRSSIARSDHGLRAGEIGDRKVRVVAIVRF